MEFCVIIKRIIKDYYKTNKDELQCLLFASYLEGKNKLISRLITKSDLEGKIISQSCLFCKSDARKDKWYAVGRASGGCNQA